MKKLTFEIRSQHISKTLFTRYSKFFQTQTKPIIVTIQERNRSRPKSFFGLALVNSRVLNGMVAGWMQKAGSVCLPQH